MERKYKNPSEKTIVDKVKQFTDVDEKMKIISVTEDFLYGLSTDQYRSLIDLKKFKWSLQFTIK